MGTSEHTLTFTKSRYVSTTSEKDLGGQVTDEYQLSGTWRATDTTVTRTWYNWDEENDRRVNEPTRLAKNYLFADAGGDLLIKPWIWDDPTDDYWRYTRVTNPIQNLLTGTWEWDCQECDPHERVTIIFSDDNSYTRRWVSTSDTSVSAFRQEGSYNHDVENGFILLMPSAVTSTENGEPVEVTKETEERFVGQTLRLAYAPTERPDVIAVSPYVIEQDWNPTTRMREDDSNYPYGDYHRLMKRLDRTN